MSLAKMMRTPYSLVDVDVATEVDPDTGDDVRTATPADPPPPALCYFEQTASTETNSDREQTVVLAFAAFPPAGAPAGPAARVVIEERTWSVVGEPNRVLRRGVVHHVECQLQLVT